jgi:hypothetical protein
MKVFAIHVAPGRRLPVKSIEAVVAEEGASLAIATTAPSIGM